MKLNEIIDFLEAWAPPSLQESYDNAGLITGHPDMELTAAIICLDCIEDVVQEAIDTGCNLIIAHHPIVFKGLKRFNGANYVERVVIQAIKHDIAIYAAHTNLDHVLDGVNGKIAQKLGLTDLKILAPKPDPHPVNGTKTGAGMIGLLPQAMSEADFLPFLKKQMKADCIRYTQLLGRDIRTVALCGGAGSFLLKQAIRQKADVFITGDFKYHEFFDAENQLVIADIGHYESEQFTIDLFYEKISVKFPTFAFRSTKINTNPINYI